MQRQLTQTERVVSIGRERDFLDRTRAIVPLGPDEHDLRWFHRACRNEIILGDALHVSAIAHGDVIGPILLYFDRAVRDISRSGGEGDLPTIIKRENAVRQGPIGDHLELRLSPFDRSQVTAVLLNIVAEVHPLGMMVRHPDLFHGGDIGDA